MALALTFTTKSIPISEKASLLTIRANGTGDASGGEVTGSIDIKQFIPVNSSLTILDAGCQTGDADTSRFVLQMVSTEWEHLPMGYIIGAGQNSYCEIYNTAHITTPKNNSAYNFPLFIGKSISSTAGIAIYFQSNANGKDYVAFIRFLVHTL